MKFKPGDKVTIPERNDITDLISDMMQEVSDGSMTHLAMSKVERALWEHKPLTIDSIEDDGYILRLGKIMLTGVHEERHLRPFTK